MRAVPEIQPLFQRALQLHQKGLLKHARTLYEEILVSHPSHFDACHLLGVSHMQTGSPERAAELISKALTLNPESADAHFNLGHALRAIGRANEALASIDRAIGLRPCSAEYHLERGIMLQAAGKLPEALACFEEVTRLDPSFAEGHRRRAGALAKVNRLDDALASCEEAIRLAPRSAEAHGLKGKVLGRLHRLEQALASHDAAIKLDPRLAESYRQRGRILGRLRRFEDSVADYDRAIQLEPEQVETYIHRADALNQLRRYKDALASCETAIALRSVSPDAHNQRGFALGGLNRMDEALESFNRAMSLDKKKQAAWTGRAWLHALCDRWELARHDYEEALRNDPTNEDAFRGLAFLPEGFLSDQVAGEILLRLDAVSQTEALPTRLFLKARLLRHLRRYEESFKCLQHANQRRLTEMAQRDPWRQHFVETQQNAESWLPVAHNTGILGEKARLLIILGPSRGGKTTLERQFIVDRSFLRGFEGGSASAAIGSLLEIAQAQESSGQLPRPVLSRRVFEAIFPSIAEELLADEKKVVTTTNPFLLAVAHLIHDLYPQSFFIFLSRDAVDTAAEIFAKDYRDRYLFAYSPRDALDYVAFYQKASAVLCKKMGSRAITVSYEDLLASPQSVLTAIYGMLGLSPPDQPIPAGESRDPRSVYREHFAALCAEQGIVLER